MGTLDHTEVIREYLDFDILLLGTQIHEVIKLSIHILPIESSTQLLTVRSMNVEICDR